MRKTSAALIAITAALLSTATASADPSAQVDAQGTVRDGNYQQAPENVQPTWRSGCTYWEKSHKGSNGRAQEDFHRGLGTLVATCGG